MRNIDIYQIVFGIVTRVGIGESGHKKKVALCIP